MFIFSRITAPVIAASILLRLSTSSVLADSLYWDPTSTGGMGGGTGAWDFASPVWATAASDGTNTAWVDGSDAVFGGTAGNVTLASPISVHSLNFSTTGYVINTAMDAPLILTGGIAATANTGNSDDIAGLGGVILSGDQTISTVYSVNIQAVLSGMDVLTKTGPGTLGLSAVNAFTGRFVVNQGFLGINSDDALGVVPAAFRPDSITLDTGGALVSGVNFRGTSSHDNAGTVTLDANRGITLGAGGGTIRVGFGSSGTLIVNGVISGAGSLTKTDGGTLVLNADNTYQGATTIGGTLQVGSGGTSGSLGAGAITFAGGTTNLLTYNRSDAVTFSQNIATGGRANIGVASGQVLTVNGAFSGAGELWKRGNGTLVVEGNGSSTRASNNVIVEGSLQVSDLARVITSPLGTGNIYIGHSSVPSAVAGLSYTGDSVSTDAVQNVQSMNGFVEVTKPATTLTFTNRIVSNTRTGGTNDSVLTKLGAGTWALAGDIDNNLRVKVSEGTLVLGKNSSASVHAVANSAGALTYALVQNGGTVRLGGSGGDQIYNPSTVQINGGTFDFNGQNEAFDTLLSSGSTGVITNELAGTNSILTLGVNNGSSIYDGKIQDGAGTISFTKEGTGSVTLTGANFLSGDTLLNAGRLIVNGSLTGSSTFVSNATLGGTGTVGDVVVFGGTVSPGATASGMGVGKLTTGSLDLSLGGTLQVAIDTNTIGSSLVEVQGNLSLGLSTAVLSLSDVGSALGAPIGTTFTIVSYAGSWDGGTFLFSDIGMITDGATFDFGSNTYMIDYDAAGGSSGFTDVTLSVVPEPATSGLLLGGLALLGGWRRRRVVRV